MNVTMDDSCTRLEDPITLEGILNRCPEFNIRSSEVNDLDREEDTDICQVYPYDKLEPYCLPETLEPCSDDDSEEIDEITKSFPVFRKQMFDLTGDGKIMKKIERPGCLQGIPEDGGKWIAYVHYAAYVEFAEFPFDVTRLRHKKPYQIRIGNNEVIPGLETAIKSMKKNEKAKFLIHPDLAYRKEGIPPRIPPNATILFDVELIDICQDTKKYDEENVEELLTFQDRLKKAKKCRERGNKYKKYEKNVNGAISAYRKGVYLLVQSKLANDEEEAEAQEELLKLYTNLAVCYMARNDFKKVCIAFNDAKHDCPRFANKNVKLLYNSAKALRNLGDFPEATRRLRLALKLKPGDQSILDEMVTLEECKKKHKAFEKLACKKMFGFFKQNELQPDEDFEDMENISVDFIELLKETLDEFQTSSNHKLDLAFGCTAAEVELIRRECKMRKFEVRVTYYGQTPKIVIIKREL